MATVTTSLGVGTSHDENAAISAVSGVGPWIVTIAANSSVNGDALWDEHATPRKYLITAGGGTTSLTVRDSTGVGSEPDNSGTSASQIKRYYGGSTPITDFEADLDDTDLLASGDDPGGEGYNDSAFDESVTIDGGGTVGLNSITTTVPSGERHDGTAGTGARMVATAKRLLKIRSAVTVTFEWLEWEGNGQNYGTSDVIILGGSGSGHSLNLIILHNLDSAADQSAELVGIRLKRTDVRLLNSIIYDIDRGNALGGGVIGVEMTDLAANIMFTYNTTVHNVSISNASKTTNAIGIKAQNANITTKNTIITDTSTAGSGSSDDFSGTFDTESNNLSSDATASGSNSLINKTSANQFVSNSAPFDLHLKSGADAIDAGIDLGTTPAGVEIDIDGRDRDAQGDVWDMGADELVAAVGITAIAPASSFTFSGIVPATDKTVVSDVASFVLTGIVPATDKTVVSDVASFAFTATSFSLINVAPVSSFLLTGIVPTVDKAVVPAFASWVFAGIVAGTLKEVDVLPAVMTFVAKVEVVTIVPSEIVNMRARGTAVNLDGRSANQSLPGRVSNISLPDR